MQTDPPFLSTLLSLDKIVWGPFHLQQYLFTTHQRFAVDCERFQVENEDVRVQRFMNYMLVPVDIQSVFEHYLRMSEALI